jgi:hypothetical protein
MFVNPFRMPSKSGTEWFSVGLASSYPDVALDDNEPRICGKHGSKDQPGCKVFHVPRNDASQAKEVEVVPDNVVQDLTDQVLVFNYRGTIHAIDHV